MPPVSSNTTTTAKPCYRDNASTLAGVFGQTRKAVSQPRYCKIHECPNLRHRKPAVRGNQMHGQRRGFVVCEDNFERAFPYLLGNLKRKDTRDTLPIDCER
jgi:hypothetical protein